jgi:hypothetical protein
MALSAALTTDVVVSYADHTTTTLTPGTSHTQVSTATTHTILAAPAASTQRQIQSASITNMSTTTSQTVTIKLDDAATERQLHRAVLGPLEVLRWDGVDWFTCGADGLKRSRNATLSPVGGYTIEYQKVATGTMEAAAIYHSLHALAGTLGAWAPGTPGLAGRATDGTTTTDNGCLRVRTPASGASYLVGYQALGNVTQAHFIHDILWINSGAVVTTTTAQTVNSVAFPARDVNGSTDGEGLQVGVLVTAATTNAGAVTNMTLSYTNQAGVGTRTATMASFPATAVAGTIVWFDLQAGDYGVRSIQSHTLGTSLVTGSVSLIVARRLAVVGGLVVNTVFGAPIRTSDQGGAGIRLYAGSCILPGLYTTATSTTIASGLLTIEER